VLAPNGAPKKVGGSPATAANQWFIPASIVHVQVSSWRSPRSAYTGSVGKPIARQADIPPSRTLALMPLPRKASAVSTLTQKPYVQ
jgi:hypothetical protein